MTTVAYPPSAVASTSSLVVFSAGASVHAHDPASSKVVSSPSAEIKDHQTSFIRLLAVHQDGKLAATVGDDKSLKVWDIGDEDIKLRSTRALIKKGSHVSFGHDAAIIVSDKVGDVLSYPLDPVPADPSTSKVPMHMLVSDPSKNPECTYLLGHVSVLTSHVITSDGKYIITADRDEHIRVSRYPKAYVIEKHLFGHDGFVSALDIPATHPTTLISGGGDASLRIWDIPTGSLLSRVDIYPAVLPHRRVRANMRTSRFKGRQTKAQVPLVLEGESSGDADGETFYSAPDGWMLPSGQGVCIKKIQSVRVGNDTVVLFFSEGAAAMHSFTLSDDPSRPSAVQTLPLPHPVLDFTPVPSQPGQILVSLDTAWNVLKKNPPPGVDAGQAVIEKSEVHDAEREALIRVFTVVHVGAGAALSQEAATAFEAATAALPKGDLHAISKLNLYPLLNILPRWPGLEDEEESGPVTGPAGGEDGVSVAPSGVTAGGSRKVYTPEELEQLNTKKLGRLKAAGVDIGNLLVQRQKKAKEAHKKSLAAAAAAGASKQAPPPKKQKKSAEGGVSEEEMANANA
ncbi:hypothetical protein IAU60_006399 [Kwoniella sp. DSM 27419]